MVMQVLVLAVQNAVQYSELGVATSGATLFRSIGGSLGTATLGAIFANRLSTELEAALPAAARSHASGAQLSPALIAHLPASLRLDYLNAFTNALNTVFLVASAVAAVAFVLSWYIRQLPLRETVASADMADTFAPPRDTDSLAVIVNKIGRLDRRAGAHEIILRVASRAGVDLDPAACWLLARLSEDAPADLPVLAERAGVAVSRLTDARDLLIGRGLIAVCPDHAPAYELTDAGHATVERLTRTGEQRLADLLEDWRPEENPDLARLIVSLARDFFVDASALRARIPEPAAAAASA